MTTTTPTPRPPLAMRLSRGAQLLAGAALLIGGTVYGIATASTADVVGPAAHVISITAASVIFSLPLLLLAARSTSGSRRWRMITSVILAATPLLLIVYPLTMLGIVAPALIGLALLWAPSSSAFVRTVHEREDEERFSLEKVLEDDTFQPRIPFSNLGQGVHQPPGL